MIALTKKQRKEQKKIDRRNKANQLRRNKKDMVNILYICVYFFFYKKCSLNFCLTKGPTSLLPLGPDRKETSGRQGRSSSPGRCDIPACRSGCKCCHQNASQGDCGGYRASGGVHQWTQRQFWVDFTSF